MLNLNTNTFTETSSIMFDLGTMAQQNWYVKLITIQKIEGRMYPLIITSNDLLEDTVLPVFKTLKATGVYTLIHRKWSTFAKCHS